MFVQITASVGVFVNIQKAESCLELTAYLCKMYDLDPLKDGVVISHAEGAKRGIASNHGDPDHWLKKHGKTMKDFRKAVAAELTGDPLAEYKANIKKKAGLSDSTIKYLADYKYGADLLKKLSKSEKK